MDATETGLVKAIPGIPQDTRHVSQRLVSAFLSGRNEKTLLAYGRDLADFAAFLGVESATDAANFLLGSGHGHANETAHRYRADLLDRIPKLAPATVNRRLAALRSMVKLARTLGMVAYALEVQNVESMPYRDTRGPGRDGVRRILDELDKRLDAKGKRDRAMVRLLYDLALRRAEVVGLDLADLDPEGGKMAVLGKRRTQKETLSLPDETMDALKSWLAVRGMEPGPLFVNFDRAHKGNRLTGRSLHRIITDLGLTAGIKARPHGLRHAAITEALDKTNGNVRAVSRFSRHRDLRVLRLYDDNREDLGGEVARVVASSLGK